MSGYDRDALSKKPVWFMQNRGVTFRSSFYLFVDLREHPIIVGLTASPCKYLGRCSRASARLYLRQIKLDTDSLYRTPYTVIILTYDAIPYGLARRDYTAPPSTKWRQIGLSNLSNLFISKDSWYGTTFNGTFAYLTIFAFIKKKKKKRDHRTVLLRISYHFQYKL